VKVTLMADASRDPATGISGWGGWIASDRGRRMCGGLFRSLMDSITVAEMAAIVNVVEVGRRNGLVMAGDRVLIQTDSRDAMLGLQGLRLIGEAQEKRAEALFCDATVGLFVVIRHVKAHTDKTDARSLSNGHCDKEAKRHMRAARRAFNKESK
jgi:ribonuclease HI